MLRSATAAYAAFSNGREEFQAEDGKKGCQWQEK